MHLEGRNRGMGNDQESKKRELLQKINEAREQAQKYVAKAQGILGDGQLFVDAADATERVIEKIDGSQVPVEGWDHQVVVWENSKDRIQHANLSLSSQTDLPFAFGMITTAVTIIGL